MNNISRFFGITNREAMRQVRLALGPDALIVSNRRVNGGVEILATDETSIPQEVVNQVALQEADRLTSAPPVTMRSAVAGSAPSAGAVAPVSQTVQPATRAVAANVPHSTQSQNEQDVMGAIDALQGVMESRMDELVWGNQLRRVPQAISLFQTLLGFGFSTALLRAMLKHLPAGLGEKAALKWARGELVRNVSVLTNEDDLWRPGVAVALVGPTGVGKTTTIAKLAARCVKRQGAQSVVLITTDTYRIGAHEQLKIYARMMHVPVHVVQDSEELRRVLETVGPHQTILIDNAGISQRDRFVNEQAVMLSRAGREVQRLLVLNAASHGDTLDEVARRYTNDGGSPLRGCIITKIDEATRLGAVLDTVIRYQLQVCYGSDGQRVPQNLACLTAAELVDKALVKHQHAQDLYAPSETDFAAILSLSTQAEPQPEKEQQDRRKALLPNLLTVARSATAPVQIEEIEKASDFIEEHGLASETYALWRAYFKGQASESMASLSQHFLRVARNEFVGNQGQYMLALHDHMSLRDISGGSAAGRLCATVLLSQTGSPWCSPYQQLTLPDGWRASDGDTALRAPAPQEALQKQLQWVEAALSDIPVLNVFGGATMPVWAAAISQGLSWLSPCTRTTRVFDQDCATTVGALTKTMTFHPVGALGGLLDRVSVQGVERGQLVVWVATQKVSVVSRQLGRLSVNLISVRAVDRQDGRVVREISGLSHVSFPGVMPENLGIALLIHAEHKMALKFAACWWPMLAQRQWADADQKRALTAMQVGLTTWEAYQSSRAQPLMRALQGLTGTPRPTQAQAVSAMMKLFTLKEMAT